MNSLEEIAEYIKKSLKTSQSNGHIIEGNAVLAFTPTVSDELFFKAVEKINQCKRHSWKKVWVKIWISAGIKQIIVYAQI
ncbi:hypothetical protein COV49_02540 [Candidatus Falkowbacteria bacterium CG11_big_fil_rev_8_21_14_0_20_39_10]|uniref:Uncharacterized protein n=1 Tax=Candidatus Falkowbacteria bacterium CG11_big_fil_rev_8_21_14_0_20_39_10 TaxID=1974570 RepID=A0A2M6K8Z3_9BACT|nr:MAG: hypothetical protein COV49_02540 [Candidatus Falkowbacteria bacterium CG11_big_fil_rev_8_21_14_0_20_39_10]